MVFSGNNFKNFKHYSTSDPPPADTDATPVKVVPGDGMAMVRLLKLRVRRSPLPLVAAIIVAMAAGHMVVAQDDPPPIPLKARRLNNRYPGARDSRIPMLPPVMNEEQSEPPLMPSLPAIEDSNRPKEPAAKTLPPIRVEMPREEILKKPQIIGEKKDEKKEEKNDDKTCPAEVVFKATWKDGLIFESSDKKFTFVVGGRTQIDVVSLVAPDAVQFGPGGVGRTDDGIGFRRARFDIMATLYETIEFYCQYDFENTFVVDRVGGVARAANTPVPTDLWVTFTKVPYVGNIRVGNHKPPISFEHLTSSRYLNFLERSLGFDAFIGGLNNGFEPGISAFDNFCNERGTWAIGLFRRNNTIFGWNTGDGEGELTGRLTYLPFYECEGRYLVHVGVGASHIDPDDDTVRFRARPPLGNGPAALHTTMMDAIMTATNQQTLVPEFVVVWGPWTFQSEYMANWANGALPVNNPGQFNPKTVFVQSAYMELLYFLTGEHREYSKKSAAFGRVTPRRYAKWGRDQCGCLDCGPGAWQLAARYQFIDFKNSPVNGGLVHDLTLGVNWFLNPNMKIQWNYTMSHRDMNVDGSDGIIHGFGARLAWDF
jgi:phosphate-selective porin OprO/OprP